MKSKILILLFSILLLSCNENTRIVGAEGKWHTTYKIYYSTYETPLEEIYTENEVYVCSFNGTNYLIEKDKPEELVSTTAPIRIMASEKIEKND